MLGEKEREEKAEKVKEGRERACKRRVVHFHWWLDSARNLVI